MPVREFGILPDRAELDRFGHIVKTCFHALKPYWPSYAERLGAENFRVVRQQGEIVAGLGLYRMGQWWGGSSLPMVGLAAVGVAPEHRGQGIAAELLSHTLIELAQQGIPLATLYPATQKLYRKVGFEVAGSQCWWTIPTQSLSFSDHSLPMYRVEVTQTEPFEAIYQTWSPTQNGMVDRTPLMWERVVKPWQGECEAYLVGSPADPQGYVILTQDDQRTLEVQDMVGLTPSALKRIWTFFTDHRSLIEKIRWSGPLQDPLLALMPEQTFRLQEMDRWMVRILNLESALSQRGYAPELSAEIHLQVEDPLLPHNQGLFVLEVEEGKGSVRPGGRGDIQMGIRGLATLFSGLLSARQGQALGFLTGSDAALRVADQLFGGSEPWMADFF